MTAPLTSSLWTVDENGIGIGKPLLWNEPTDNVKAAYRELLSCGTPAQSLRITSEGTRPDSLGYRK